MMQQTWITSKCWVTRGAFISSTLVAYEQRRHSCRFLSGIPWWTLNSPGWMLFVFKVLSQIFRLLHLDDEVLDDGDIVTDLMVLNPPRSSSEFPQSPIPRPDIVSLRIKYPRNYNILLSISPAPWLLPFNSLSLLTDQTHKVFPSWYYILGIYSSTLNNINKR